MRINFLLTAITVLGLVPTAGLACSTVGPTPTDEENFAKAKVVFVAHITKTEETTLAVPGAPTPTPIVEGSFQVIEVLKGTPPKDGKVRDPVFGPGNCSLGLLAGLDYLFFLYEDDFNFVLSPGGSRGFVNIKGTEPKNLLEKLRKLSKSPK